VRLPAPFMFMRHLTSYRTELKVHLLSSQIFRW